MMWSSGRRCLVFCAVISAVVVGSSNGEDMNRSGRVKRQFGGQSLSDYIKHLAELAEATKTATNQCGVGLEDKTNDKGEIECFECPVGSYWNKQQICEQCGVGYYANDARSIECTACSSEKTTLSTGTNSSLLCVDKCPKGTFSSNGLMVPATCGQCKVGTYQDDIAGTMCHACPFGTITSDAGTQSAIGCLLKCQQGQFSATGLEPCYPCPKSHYAENRGMQGCRECPYGLVTLKTGAISKSACIDVDECKLPSGNPCKNGATCSDRIGAYKCICLPGWKGTLCGENVDDCVTSPCENGGECVDGINSYTCKCGKGWKGLVCDERKKECRQKVNGKAVNPCKNQALCFELVGDFECQCRTGFTGNLCETNINDCTATSCENGGTCVDGIDGFTCVCRTGYTGPTCAENVDDCLKNPAHCINGVCVDAIGSSSCSCYAGWMGSRCETDVNECAKGPCLNGGTCLNLQARYECGCKSYYNGTQCQGRINDCFNLNMLSSTNNDFAIHRPIPSQTTITEFTMRFSMFVSSSGGLTSSIGTIFSYGSTTDSNALYIMNLPPVQMIINDDTMVTNVMPAPNGWTDVCLTWTSSGGAWRSMLNGNLVGSGNRQTGVSVNKPISGGGFMILGQKITDSDGIYLQSNTFHGKLNNFRVWFRYNQCGSSSPNIVWANLASRVEGPAIVRETGQNAGGRC